MSDTEFEFNSGIEEHIESLITFLKERDFPPLSKYRKYFKVKVIIDIN